MDIKIPIITTIIILLGGCDQVTQSPGNNIATNTNVTTDGAPLIVVRNNRTKNNENISIREITNLYNTLAYKYKMANWRAEIRTQEILNGQAKSKEANRFLDKIDDLYVEYSNNWDQISNYDDKFYVTQRYFEEELVNYINSENPKFVRQAIETLCIYLEKNGRSDEILSCYDEGISVLSSRVDDNPSVELCENLGGLYGSKAGYLDKNKNYEGQLQPLQKAVDFISKTKDSRLISGYNQALAALYQKINPYQKEKVIEALQAVERAWTSIEKPTRKDEVDAYYEIESIRQTINSVEQGGKFYIIGGY